MIKCKKSKTNKWLDHKRAKSPFKSSKSGDRLALKNAVKNGISRA